MAGLVHRRRPAVLLGRPAVTKDFFAEILDRHRSPGGPGTSARAPHQLLAVSAGRASRPQRDQGKVGTSQVGTEVFTDDLHQRDRVGQADVDVAVKPPGTDERGVELVRVIARPYHDDPFPAAHPVDLRQERVHDLNFPVGPCMPKGATVRKGVDFVQEHDRG
jgi:hypothetical protein